MLSLKNNLKYEIFVHDPEFFYWTSSKRAIPGFRQFLDIKDEVGSYFFSDVEVIRHVNIPRNEKSCEENPNYSFKMCIKKSAINSVGCRQPWVEEVLNISICQTFDQFLMHEKYYQNVAFKEQKTVLKITVY